MYAISIKNLTKHFRKRTVQHTTVKSELVRWIRGKKASERSTITRVLQGVNLSVPRGATLGVVGRNGSGKSTLLKLITGIYAPTSGTIDVHGRVSALLELGAGFHPDFSGRENILINGIILGMSRAEIRARMQDIIAFSELEDFIDEPVRTYSSGMFMRLAFSVATHVDPDILVIDEILSVGDSHFARKSRAKMDEFKGRGKTIVLVTHDLSTVERWCDMAVWLNDGQLSAVGDPHYVVDRYRRAIATAEAGDAMAEGSKVGMRIPNVVPPAIQPVTGPPAEPDKRWGVFRVELTDVRVLGRDGSACALFAPDDPLTLAMDFMCKAVIQHVSFHVTVFRKDLLPIWDISATSLQLLLPEPLPREGTVRLHLPRLGLGDGDYRIDVAVFGSDEGCYYDFHKSLYGFSVRSRTGDFGVVKPDYRWSFSVKGEMQPSAYKGAPIQES